MYLVIHVIVLVWNFQISKISPKPHLWDWQGEQMPHSFPEGGGRAHQEFIDAL